MIHHCRHICKISYNLPGQQRILQIHIFPSIVIVGEAVDRVVEAAVEAVEAAVGAAEAAVGAVVVDNLVAGGGIVVPEEEVEG